MIDVSPFIDKLELLKEYMGLCIEDNISVWKVARYETSEGTYPEPKKVFDNDGKLLRTVFGWSLSIPIPEKITFEEWLETITHKAL